MKSALRHHGSLDSGSSHHARDDSSSSAHDDNSDFFSVSLDECHSEHSSALAALKPPVLKANVSFGKVVVREYERVVEDNTYLGIGWHYNKDSSPKNVDAFEEKRDGHRRTQDELRLSAGERQRIAVAHGCEKKKAARPMALSMI